MGAVGHWVNIRLGCRSLDAGVRH